MYKDSFTAEKMVRKSTYSMEIDNSSKDSNFDLPDTVKSLSSSLAKFSQIANNFVSSYKPIVDSINNFILKLVDATKPLQAISILASNQFVVWNYLDDDLVDEIVKCNNINKLLRIKHEKERYKSTIELVEKCADSKLLTTNRRVFEQSVNAFMRGDYDLAVIGLTSVIDGAVTVLSGSNKTSIYSRTKPLIEKLENTDSLVALSEKEMSLLVFVYTFDKTLQTFTANSDFSKKEPKMLNRHWIIHGRCLRRRTKLDCVKLIRIINGLNILFDFQMA